MKARTLVAASLALAGLGCSGDPFGHWVVVEDVEGDAGAAAEAGAAPDSGDPLAVVPMGLNGVRETPCGAARDRGAPEYDREVCFPAQSFTMGSAEPNLGSAHADHSPPHRVSLDAFLLDAFEVTRSRYGRCVEEGACEPPPEDPAAGCTSAPHQPATCVRWADALAFCEWDGGRRLPTEAEWELAARGEDDRAYPWGADFECSRAVLGGGGTCPEHTGPSASRVGSLPAGATSKGVFDLSGNAAEWVLDWVGSYPTSDVVAPTGPSKGTQRVLRGGEWRSLPAAGMTYVRASSDPQIAGPWGFRCARSAE